MINAEFKDTFNNTVMIRIAGTTPVIREDQPDPFIIKDCSITYNDNSLKPGVNDYKGSITFVGSFNDYRAFGAIGHETHEVTVTSAGLTFRGYLLPEVYDMEYTGHSVPFTLNFESILGQLEREVFNEPTNLYSIEDIINNIVSITGCTVDHDLSFSESFSTLKVYSANFINDDNNKENYMKILEWIACTFGLKITLWGTLLTFYSCEKMQDVNNPYPVQHYGIDETVSVNEQCDTCAVHVNNYELPDFPDDFSLQGARKLLDQPPMRIRRGQENHWSKRRGSYNIYHRQIYEYQPGQKAWNFNKYDKSGNPVDEFDESQYIIDGVPLAGAYPIAWGKIDSNGQFSGMEQAIWFKSHNSGTYIPFSKAHRMISCHLDNFLSKPNTFLFFAWQAAWIAGHGDVNNWNRGWVTNYDADNDGTYSSNFDECAVAIDPSIEDGKLDAYLLMSVRFTDLSGTVYYWYPFGINPTWSTTESLEFFEVPTNEVAEFKFGSTPQRFMVSPMLKNGGVAIFEETMPDGIWVRLPETMGILDISIGFSDFRVFQSLLFRGMSIDLLVAKEDVSEIDLSKNSDVVYGNTENETTDASEDFYMYSENEHFGRGQLYNNDANTRVDTLTYPYGSDKPEWNYIAIMTQLYSKAQVNNDIISINDFDLLYSDRYVNGASIDFLTGLVKVSTVKPKSYTLSKVI